MLALLKQLVNQSSAEINGSETDASWQTSEKSELKELSMCQKLPWQRISKGKSRSVYIEPHLKRNLEEHKNTTHLDNPIDKVTMMKSIYLMSIWLKDPLVLLGWNLMWSISISTNPCRAVLIQSIIENPKLVLNLKPSWLLSQSQGYSKKMGKYAPV